MMRPPEKENARGAEGPGAQNRQLSEEEILSDTPLDTSKQEVSADIHTLQIVFDWVLDFRARSDRLQLAAEVIGVSDEKLAELRHEGVCLKRIMLAIAPKASA